MSRIIIPGARTASPARRLVLPDGLLGRASLWFDGVDDKVSGSIPVALSGTAPWTLWARVFPQQTNVADAAILAIGNYVANQYAALRLVASGGKLYLGGVTTGTTRRSVYPAEARWYAVAMRFAGGAGGAIVVTVDAETLSDTTWPAPALTGFVSYLGSHNAAIPYRGAIADARVYDADIGAAGVAALREGKGWGTNLVRRWSCETPGFGATCREEVGGTDDAISGALWSPVVPFRRQRIVEDVPYCVRLPTGQAVNLGQHADFDFGAGSFSVMFDAWLNHNGGVRYVVSKVTGGVAGWYVVTTGNAIQLSLQGGGSVFIPAAEWSDGHHQTLCVVDRDTATARVYLDDRRPVVGAIGACDVDIAADLYCPGATASDSIGHLALWDRVVTWDEWSARVYNGTVPASPVAYWPMEEAAGNVIDTVAGKVGTVSGGAVHTTVTRCKARTAA